MNETAPAERGEREHEEADDLAGDHGVRIEKLYRALMGRASDTAGLNAHYNYLTGSPTAASWNALIDAFLSSAEFSDGLWSSGGAYDGQIC